MKTPKPTQTRRPKGEGSIFRDSEGWKGYITVNGKRLYRQAKTKSEVSVKLKQAQAEGARLRSRRSPTLIDFIREQLQGPLQDQLRFATWKMYETFWRVRVAPAQLGEMRITEIRYADVQRFIDAHRGMYKASTLRRLGSFVCMILERAVELEWIATNPARKIRYPVIYETEREVLAIEDARTFFETFKSERLHDMVTVAVHTGIRRGELCGIRWEDIDAEAKVLHVRVQITRIDKGIVESKPKTRGSIRSIELTETAYQCLARQPRRSKYVFTTESGQPLRPDTLARDFRLAVRGTPYAALRLHDLRASYISMLLALGTDIRTVQEMVGHTSADMTLRVYARSQRSLKRRAADLLETATMLTSGEVSR